MKRGGSGRLDYIAPEHKPRGPYDVPFKSLPPGLLLRVQLPKGTTPNELSEYLMANNVPVTPDRISIRDFGRKTSGVIAVPYDVIAYWVQYSLEQSENLFRNGLLSVSAFYKDAVAIETPKS